MKPWLRQGIWLVAALIAPVLLSLALLPLRDHVSDVLIALVLLTVSAAAVARGELLLSLVAATSTALSFDYFFTVPHDQFAIRSARGVVTTVALIAAVPALGTWIGRLHGKEAARERELREKAERYAGELAERQRQVEQLAADLTASRRRILAVGDEMRRRIERDLHDGVQQRLVTLSLMLRGVRADVDEVCDGLAGTLEELRDLSRGLHPAILVEAGLGPAVRALARRSPLPVRVQMQADGRLPGSCEATAYYVAAEAFTNAAKHAKASAVDILIERADGTLTVQVRDDGVGGADTARGSGLVGLRDRVEAVGGIMTLDSPARAGSVLTVRLPVTTEDHLSERAGPATSTHPARGRLMAGAHEPVAVLGIGAMGHGMAASALRAGIPTIVWNRKLEATRDLAELGAEVAESAADAARRAGIVVTMVTDADAVMSVARDQGMLAALAPGAIWAQMSTIGVAGIDRVAAMAGAERPDVMLLDAPVSGSKDPAERGQLTIFASGPGEARPRVVPLFDALGQRTIWVGEAGAGTRLKLVNNTWLAFAAEAVAASVALARRLGLETETVVDALGGGTLVSPWQAAKLQRIAKGEFSAQFALSLALKDVHLALQAADDDRFAVLACLADEWQQAVDQGLGEQDLTVVTRVLEQQGGTP